MDHSPGGGGGGRAHRAAPGGCPEELENTYPSFIGMNYSSRMTGVGSCIGAYHSLWGEAGVDGVGVPVGATPLILEHTNLGGWCGGV